MEIKLVYQLNEHFRTVIVPKYPKLFNKNQERIGMFCEERHTYSRQMSFFPIEREETITLTNFWDLHSISFRKQNNYIDLELTFKDFSANKQVTEFPLPVKYYMKSMVIRKEIGIKEYKQIVEASSDYHERIDNLFPGAYGYRYITDKCYQYFLNCGMLAYIEFIFNEIEKDIPKNNKHYYLEPIKGEIVINERYLEEAEKQVIENQRIEEEKSKEEMRQKIFDLYIKPERYPRHRD